MKGAARAWQRFWFAPRSVATIAVVRIAFGAVMTAWTASLGPDLMTFFSRRGLVPVQPSHAFWIGLLSPSAPDWAVYAVWAGLLVASACLAAGYHSRLASVAAFVGLISFVRRNPYLFDAGDLLLRNISIFLMFAPTGAALSVDAWRGGRERFGAFPKRPQWALRLIQLQIVAVYAETVWAKLRYGAAWRHGTAVSYALRFDELSRFRAPSFISDSAVMSHVLTYGTLAVEASLVVLVWNRKTRPWVLGAGVLLHLAISTSLMIEFFTLAVLVGYLSFVPPEAMERFLGRWTGTANAALPAAPALSAEPAG